jgi:hypothetical protein
MPKTTRCLAAQEVELGGLHFAASPAICLQDLISINKIWYDVVGAC